MLIAVVVVLVVELVLDVELVVLLVVDEVVLVVVLLGGKSVVVVDVVLVDVELVLEVVLEVVVLPSGGIYRYIPIPLGRQNNGRKLSQFILLLLGRVCRSQGTFPQPLQEL